MNRSEAAHLDLINRNLGKNWDVICLQEPHITKYGNIRTPKHFRQVYPVSRGQEGTGKVRSAMWINNAINTNGWEIIEIPGTNDITAAKIKTVQGNVAIFNVYNPCDSNSTQTKLNNYLCNNRQEFYGAEDRHVVWCGDFNRHHPLWDRVEDVDLFIGQNRERTERFIEILAEHDMQMALPRDIPTLCTHRTKRYTRPDNVFVSRHLEDLILNCDVDASWRPPNTDHFPIITILELPASRIKTTPGKNFRMTDWECFRRVLEEKLGYTGYKEELETKEELEEAIEELTKILQETIEEVIPDTKISPYMKRWWTKELEALKKELNRTNRKALKVKYNMGDPIHAELRALKNAYADTIFTAKKKHWENFLEEAAEKEMWTANRYLTEPVGDGGSPRIPTLRTTGPNGSIMAHTTNEDKARILGESFFPKKPQLMGMADREYPEPHPARIEVSIDQVTANIARLSAHKAPGPDGIPNIVLQQAADLLAPPLANAFTASLNLGYQYSGWKTFTTVVLRKPGKPSYETPKAYRPIALLCTMAKLLTSIVTEEVSHAMEKHNDIPRTHYGGRPCRTTSDAVHHLVARIKEAWRKGLVVSVLYLDVEGAFPNAVTDRLIHNLRKRRVAAKYVEYVQAMLQDRRTRLRFDDFQSDPIRIDNGIGQGDPLSMLLYITYNADLLEIPNNLDEGAAGYVDDAYLLATAPDFKQTTRKLQKMMEREGGGFEWSTAHNSKFALDKLAITHFSPTENKGGLTERARARNERPQLELRGQSVEEAQMYKYLGVCIDNKLKWNEQLEKTVAKATKWALLFKRLARPAVGISQKLMRQLYLGVAVPKMTYALDVWYEPPYMKDGAKRRTGSVKALKKFTKIHRIAALAITGALSSTPNDILNAHAGLPPCHHLLESTCFRNTLRICTLPANNPVSRIAKEAYTHRAKRHQTNLYKLLHRFQLDPRKIEKIRPPAFTSADPIPFQKRIAKSREESINNEANNRPQDLQSPSYRVYSDGSGQNGKIGAAAVIYEGNKEKPSKINQYHLGSAEHHTTYDAEAVGALLAMHLVKELASLKGTPTNPARVTHYVDNQSIIRALNADKGGTGQHILDAYRRDCARAIGHGTVEIKLEWISAHSGVQGNEEVDTAAKEAAEGKSSEKKHLPAKCHMQLPHSKAAIKQAKMEELKKREKKEWKESPRYDRMNRIDDAYPYENFKKWREYMTRAQGSILTQIRSNHLPINTYLKRIKKRENDYCDKCLENTGQRLPETVNHFVLDCSAYDYERDIMKTKLGRANAFNLERLFKSEQGTRCLVDYLDATKRFRQSMGRFQILSSQQSYQDARKARAQTKNT
ncbi:hypothetical protein Agabi119p4_2586 [Agaricus bisporus var. burnettii]|uniref:Uncharacterized protein n=1 Tax=Agaricus bisporus var. burnettii TaxID=192524 RepID=A0A8H7KKH4_AGABI|nr:hypothetical protein Agabi119p4_2586 [Agaricus bisporus var. burnettii]